MRSKAFSIISLFFIFTACIDEIKLKEDYTNKKLVVSSFITNGENITVNLYQNKPVNSKFEPALKTKAKVILYENGIEKETLEPYLIHTFQPDYVNQTQKVDSTYKYVSKNTEIKTGNTYKIVVECEGYESVTAETTVASMIPIISFDSLTVYKVSNGNQYTQDNFKLSFTDPVNKTNYYRVVVMESYAQKEFITLGTDTIEYINMNYHDQNAQLRSSDPLLTSENKDANSYVFGELENRYGVFSDEMINGQTYELSFTAQFQNSSNKKIDYEAGEFRKVKLILQSINADMYYFLKSIDAQEYSDYMMFTEPVPIYSNVENGFGVFGAYVNSEIELFYGEYPKEGIKYYTWEDIMKLYEEYYKQHN